MVVLSVFIAYTIAATSFTVRKPFTVTLSVADSYFTLGTSGIVPGYNGATNKWDNMTVYIKNTDGAPHNAVATITLTGGGGPSGTSASTSISAGATVGIVVSLSGWTGTVDDITAGSVIVTVAP